MVLENVLRVEFDARPCREGDQTSKGSAWCSAVWKSESREGGTEQRQT